MRLGLIGAIALGLVSSLLGQEPTLDSRVDELRAEVARLSRTIADQERRLATQERRIASLEKAVRVLPQSAALAPPKPDWHAALNWALIRDGMPEKQVVDLLGPPTRVESVVDVRTLYYQPDPKATSKLHGSVTLKDDRVIASEAPDF